MSLHNDFYFTCAIIYDFYFSKESKYLFDHLKQIISIKYLCNIIFHVKYPLRQMVLNEPGNFSEPIFCTLFIFTLHFNSIARQKILVTPFCLNESVKPAVCSNILSVTLICKRQYITAAVFLETL